MKDAKKLRAKRKLRFEGTLISGEDRRLLKDKYLKLAQDQQRVKKAIYTMIIQGLFVIVFGIVLALVVYSL